MEDDEETIRERQESEVEALKAIYDSDFVDLRRGDAWKVYRRPEFTLRLVPNHDSRGVREEHCYVLLRIKMGQDYPAKSPPAVMKVEESKGLSDALILTLEEELKGKAKEIVGEVMVTELAQFTADWLSGHNKPAFSSFYEEMEANKRREMQMREEQMEGERRKSMVIRKLKDEQLRKEVAQSLEMIEEEKQKRKKEGEQKSEPEEQILMRSRQNQKAFSRSKSTSFSEGSDQGSRVRLKFKEVLEFIWKGEKLKVEKLECLGGNVSGGHVYASMLYPDQKLVAVSEWIFKIRGGKKSGKQSGDSKTIHDADVLLRQAASIEQEVASLQKLSHPNVVQYLAMSAQKHPSHVKLVLVEEYVHGTSLSFFLAENLSLEPEMLQYFATGILEALSYMHERNCVHRDLRDSSIFVDRLRTVRVAGFSIDKRVRDLMSPEPGEEAEERFPSSVGRGGKKLDVYRFGLLMLSLAKGEIVSDPSIPKRLNSVLCDFLKKCLCRDEKDRWSASQLLEHRWLKCRFDKPSELPLVAAERAESPEESDLAGVTAVPFVHSGSGMSRLQSEFAFISKIGKGGFGEVMKVKNLLDGQVYAIKKIKLSQANKLSTKKLMREVKLLSRLNHENVVRYYTSWIEVTTISEEKEETETSFEEASSAVTSEKVNVPKVRDVKKPSILDDLNVRMDPFGSLSELDGGAGASEVSISFASKFQDDLGASSDDEDDDDAFGTSFLPQSDGWQGDEDESMSGIVFESSENSDSRVVVGCEKSDRDDETDGRAAAVSSERKIEIQVMYIQMEYCDKQTLRSAIDEGLYKDTKRVWRMFRVRQLLLRKVTYSESLSSLSLSVPLSVLPLSSLYSSILSWSSAVSDSDSLWTGGTFFFFPFNNIRFTLANFVNLEAPCNLPPLSFIMAILFISDFAVGLSLPAVRCRGLAPVLTATDFSGFCLLSWITTGVLLGAEMTRGIFLVDFTVICSGSLSSSSAFVTKTSTLPDGKTRKSNIIGFLSLANTPLSMLMSSSSLSLKLLFGDMLLEDSNLPKFKTKLIPNFGKFIKTMIITSNKI